MKENEKDQNPVGFDVWVNNPAQRVCGFKSSKAIEIRVRRLLVIMQKNKSRNKNC